MSCRRYVSAAWFAALIFVLSAASADAQIIRRAPRRNAAGGVALPYQVGDGHGQSWLVYQASTIQMQGNMPVYQQAGTVTISGQQPNGQQQAKLDEKTNELIMDGLQVGQFAFTRRILFNTDDGYARVIDVVKNTSGQDQQMSTQLTSYINFGVQSSQTISDPKKNSVNLGWVATCNAGQAKTALDVYAGPGAKLNPVIDSQQGGNSVSATYNYTIPAGKEIAIAHFHMVVNTQDQGVQWIKDMKPAKLFSDVPKDIRREIVNFRVSGGLLGDLEVLRGDAMDVVELRSGDKFNGTLVEASYKLDTFYGTIEIPVDKVVGIINAGQFKPRQLVVTADGQIFGGHLQKPTIDLELTSGQKTAIPLAQISRIGYRRRADEKDDSADEQTLQPPYMLLASGDRVGMAMPTAPIAVVTRYGQLQLSPEVIASIIFNSDDSGVHTIELTDGSKFNGLCTATDFDVKLNTGQKDQMVKFPVAALNRIVFVNRSDEKDEAAPALQLKKDDTLTGVLQGDLKLDTAFDTIALHAPEIRAIAHSKEGPADLSVTTWDGTVFSGQLQEQSVRCHLKSGIDVQIPIALVESYSNPSATVPPMIMEKIKSLVTDLNADDFKQRDDAEHQLVKLGAGVVPTLKAMREQQTPEAQQRIDSVVKQLAR
jgi:hypothetical protein